MGNGSDSGGIPKAHGGWALGCGTWQLLATNMALGEGRLFRGVRRSLLPKNYRAIDVPIRDFKCHECRRMRDSSEFAGIYAKRWPIPHWEYAILRLGKLCRWVGFYN